MTYTKEQEQAVFFDNGNLLVSATAGSGKTRVMIDRLIRLIKEGKTDLNGILAVTFTELAAQEMREKIKNVLINEINNGNEFLKYQLMDVNTADISTIHSFCAKLIRQYFFEVGVSGDFEIIDSEEAENLKNQVITQLFYELYENKEEYFLTLTECFAEKRKDGKLKQIVLSLFENCSAEEDPDYFLNESLKNYTERGFDYFAKKIHKNCINRLKGYKAELVKLKGELLHPELKNRKAIVEDILVDVNVMLSKKSLFDYYVYSNYKTATASTRISEESKELNERFKSLKFVAFLFFISTPLLSTLE